METRREVTKQMLYQRVIMMHNMNRSPRPDYQRHKMTESPVASVRSDEPTISKIAHHDLKKTNEYYKHSPRKKTHQAKPQISVPFDG